VSQQIRLFASPQIDCAVIVSIPSSSGRTLQHEGLVEADSLEVAARQAVRLELSTGELKSSIQAEVAGV